MQTELQRTIDMGEVKERFRRNFEAVFNVDLTNGST
jgi:hypothetical protein